MRDDKTQEGIEPHLPSWPQSLRHTCELCPLRKTIHRPALPPSARMSQCPTAYARRHIIFLPRKLTLSNPSVLTFHCCGANHPRSRWLKTTVSSSVSQGCGLTGLSTCWLAPDLSCGCQGLGLRSSRACLGWNTPKGSPQTWLQGKQQGESSSLGTPESLWVGRRPGGPFPTV